MLVATQASENKDCVSESYMTKQQQADDYFPHFFQNTYFQVG